MMYNYYEHYAPKKHSNHLYKKKTTKNLTRNVRRCKESMIIWDFKTHKTDQIDKSKDGKPKHHN